MRRTPTGKRLALTPRDFELFRMLSRYRYLRSTYLHAFVGGASETRFKERLGDLYHEGYVDRPEEQWRFASGRHSPVVHELGAGGRRMLSEHGVEILDQRTAPSGTSHRQFEHSVMVSEVLASIELGARANASCRIICRPEIAAKVPAARGENRPFRIAAFGANPALLPDAVFGIEYAAGDRKRYRFLALEADRGTMPIKRHDRTQTSILGKIAAYQHFVARDAHRTEWGVPKLLVLFVTTHLQRVEGMREAVAAEYGPNPIFLFRSTPDLSRPLPALFTDPWGRAECNSLSLADPD